MILWVILGLMTAAAVFAVVWPLARHGMTVQSGNDIAVYRDQLDEVDRDLATGLIGKTEAQAARVEISRRLLAADAAAQAAPAASNPAAALWRRRAVALVTLVLLPTGAAALYLRVGSPELASATIVAEENASAGQQASVEAMVAKVEAHLQQNPNDGRGWEVLAPVYLQLGRYTDSVNAWRNVLQLLGENAEREANLGESLMAEANGIVTDAARAAFVRAVKLDATTVSARYYLGIAAEQNGQREKAAKIWRDLIADAPPGAHWVSQVRTALARVEGKAPATPSGLNAAQLAVAGQQSPQQQSDMIRSMVDRLAARLKKDGSDPDGWVRLVRSYKVLGESNKATAAAAEARTALAGDPGKLKQFETGFKNLASDKTAVPAPGLNAAQLAVAGKQPPEQQSDMIRGMVDRLAARLKKDGSDPDGWVRLVRSYKVLGEPDKATAATAEARKALAGDAGKLKQFETGFKNLASDKTAVPAPGLNAAQLAVAGKQPPELQSDMIRGMVDRLAGRLKKDGSDPDGWVRLVRSYRVLNEPDKAIAAAADARKALAGDPGKLQQFETALKDLDAGKTATSAPTPGPALTPKPAAPPGHEQDAQSMVERLAARLKKSGSDPQGWLMLTRSYLTLGEKDKATAAIKDGRRALANEPAKLAQFNDALKQFNISE